MHEFWRRGEERERGRGDAGQKCEGSGKEKNGKGIGNGRWTLLLISALGRIGRLVDRPLRFFFFFPLVRDSGGRAAGAPTSAFPSRAKEYRAEAEEEELCCP